jgi:hypothetical protein
MKRMTTMLTAALLLLAVPALYAQMTPWLRWTFLPESQMDEIIGEASGETAWNTIMETGGYNKNRPAAEYEETFYEAKIILERLKQYGLAGARIDRYPGGQTWDGVKGELWEISPHRRKIASYTDMTAMLASYSNDADVEAELVWVGMGTQKEIEAAEVEGKIVVTEGSISSVHTEACLNQGALGVVAISQSRPAFDPLQIPWRGIRGWRDDSDAEPRFGFFLPFREGHFLKQRLARGEKIKVHAVVDSEMMPFDLQNVVCHIPGTDPKAGEIIFSAHLFEGYTKQGANDNKSGSAGILEVARTLHTLIEEGRLPRPKRTIRFLWGPEFSGTGPWVEDHKEMMEAILCNINMDMVGEWLSLNQAFFNLMRTSYGNPHYINDVMENYYRFVGEGNRERIHVRSWPYAYPERIVAPTGADEPFYYSIETHFGASDHEVFNDWGVRVPGIMMIAWPDQWYHTSGDRVDKADPTQMKRVAVIGAAAAYTIATADEEMAVRIAGEIASNGTRRLGHQLVRGLELLNETESDGFNDAFRMARIVINAALDNEKATLASVLELAPGSKRLKAYISKMQKMLDHIGAAHLEAIDTHMSETAARLGTGPASVVLTEAEKRADAIVPKTTALVMAGGYRGYAEHIARASGDDADRDRWRRRAFDTRELHLLIDGKRSVLDIKDALDAQSSRRSDIVQILEYVELLKKADLVRY